MIITIRSMEEQDCQKVVQAFQNEEWNQSLEHMNKLYELQERGRAKGYIAYWNHQLAGYVYVRKKANIGPFRDEEVPEISEIAVRKEFQNQGIGTRLMNEAEEYARVWGRRICLGYGVHNSYGSVQRMCTKRGYLMDGSGIWYRGNNVEQYGKCHNKRELMLYCSKKLTSECVRQ